MNILYLLLQILIVIIIKYFLKFNLTVTFTTVWKEQGEISLRKARTKAEGTSKSSNK